MERGLLSLRVAGLDIVAGRTIGHGGEAIYSTERVFMRVACECVEVEEEFSIAFEDEGMGNEGDRGGAGGGGRQGVVTDYGPATSIATAHSRYCGGI